MIIERKEYLENIEFDKKRYIKFVKHKSLRRLQTLKSYGRKL